MYTSEANSVHIRPIDADDIEDIVELSLRAWAPVFDSFQQILGSTIYARLYPDWRTSQRAVVEAMCTDSEKMTTWVAEVDGIVAGFLVYELNRSDNIGEVQLLAVHPDYQNRGIGTALNTFALAKMQESGMQLVVVGTGGDPAHAPARKAYEKAGYTALPLVRYYKDV